MTGTEQFSPAGPQGRAGRKDKLSIALGPVFVRVSFSRRSLSGRCFACALCNLLDNSGFPVSDSDSFAGSNGDRFRVKLKDSDTVAVGNGAMSVGKVKIFLEKASEMSASALPGELRKICSIAVDLSGTLEEEEDEDDPLKSKSVVCFLPDRFHFLLCETYLSTVFSVLWQCWQAMKRRKISGLLVKFERFARK